MDLKYRVEKRADLNRLATNASGSGYNGRLRQLLNKCVHLGRTSARINATGGGGSVEREREREKLDSTRPIETGSTGRRTRGTRRKKTRDERNLPPVNRGKDVIVRRVLLVDRLSSHC